MLRSIGIPARMVVGYAQGERLSENDEFLVKIKDSHSWVEAFFPDSGWIILEPTPTQPEVILEERMKAAANLIEKNHLFWKRKTSSQDPEMGFFQRSMRNIK